MGSNGQGDEGDEGDEGYEGHEEEDSEQDREGQDEQSYGAAWKQGKDRGWPDSQGPDQEQVWQDREQEDECARKDQHVDYCRQEGARCLEGQGLCRHQEGHATLPEGKRVLEVSQPTASERWESRQEAPALAVGISTAVERRSPRLQALSVDEGRN